MSGFQNNVTKTTVRDMLAKLESGQWKPVRDAAPSPGGLIAIYDTGTKKTFTACIVDYIHTEEDKP